eukprot:COSAG01_NODE_10239_length_2212_cov_1.716990_4_plen_187_part_00
MLEHSLSLLAVAEFSVRVCVCFENSMLEIGNGALTAAEGRSQFALWCLMKAPLLSGTDISRASSDTIATLTAAEVISVSQDKLGVQVRHHDEIRGNMGFCTRGDCAIVSDGGQAGSLWVGPLANKCTTVLVLNLGTAAYHTHVTWSQIGIQEGTKMHVRDLWAKQDVGAVETSLVVSIPLAHDNQM